ncbi:MAG: hypothetical protein KA110_04090 [Acidimicrobiia bacterium]|nr:hypothetical protein [Acidimicrobiia bacterium]
MSDVPTRVRRRAISGELQLDELFQLKFVVVVFFVVLLVELQLEFVVFFVVVEFKLVFLVVVLFVVVVHFVDGSRRVDHHQGWRNLDDLGRRFDDLLDQRSNEHDQGKHQHHQGRRNLVIDEGRNQLELSELGRWSDDRKERHRRPRHHRCSDRRTRQHR